MLGKTSPVKPPTGAEEFTAAVKLLQPAIENLQLKKKELTSLEDHLTSERGKLESLQHTGGQLKTTSAEKSRDQNAFAKLRSAISKNANAVKTSAELIEVLTEQVARAKQSHHNSEATLRRELVANMTQVRQTVEAEMTEHLSRAVDLHDEYTSRFGELCDSLKMGSFPEWDTNNMTPTLRHPRIKDHWQDDPKGIGYTAVLPQGEYEDECARHGLD